MKRIIYILTLSVLGFMLTGCYGDYKNPPEEKVWEDADLIDEGYSIISIDSLKQHYYALYPVDHVANKTIISKPVVIKGTVTSNDRPGNFYRNMMIQDATGAIEIKVGKGSLQTEYRVGQTVYVIAENLVLGNYRFNLSLGAESQEGSTYANDYIDLQEDIDFHIRKGELPEVIQIDTLVVNASNYTTAIRDPQDIGRIVRFEGLTSTFGSFNNSTYPSFLQTTPDGANDPIYTDRVFADVIMAWTNYYKNGGAKPAPTSDKVDYPYLPEDRLYATWGYHDITSNNSYYGSAYFKYSNAAAPVQGQFPTGHYVVRTSGYSKFANGPIPANGAVANVTGFLNKYSGSSGGFLAYQLVLNNNTSSDVSLVSGSWTNE